MATITERNRHRINRAKDMRSAWAAYSFLDISECQPRDMLADIMHYCEAIGLDFDHELSMATDFYSDERES